MTAEETSTFYTICYFTPAKFSLYAVMQLHYRVTTIRVYSFSNS